MHITRCHNKPNTYLCAGYSGSVSGISDIDLRPQKPQAQFECSLNDVSSAPAGSDSWQQVTISYVYSFILREGSN